jgi:hypothetical protein
MPRVTSYGNQQVQTAPVPGVSLRAAPTVTSLGGPVAAGVQDLGEAADHISEQRLQVALEERAKAEQTALIEADRQLGEWENRALHDAKTGALTKRGTDAFAMPEPTLGSFDDTAAAIEKGLVGDRVKESFRRQAGARRVDIDRSLQRHVAGERETYQRTQAQAYLQTSRDAAVSAAGDPARVDREIERQGAVLEEALRGQPPEVLTRALHETFSGTYSGVVASLLDAGDARGARQEFERVRMHILPEDAAKLEKAMKVADVRQESQRVVDDLLSKPAAGGGLVPLDVALAQAKELTAKRPELREEVEQRLVTMHGLRQRAAREQDDANFRQAYSIFTAPDNGRGIDAIPATLMASLAPEHQETLRTYASQRDRGQKAETDWPAYYQLRLAAASEEGRAAFMQTNLLDYLNRLEPARFKELVDLQADLRSNGGKGGEATQRLNAGVTTANDAAREALVAAGINPEVSTKNPDAARAIAFRRQLDRQIVAAQQMGGKPLGAEDVRKLAEGLLVKQTIREKRGRWSPGRLVDDEFDDVGERYAFEAPGIDRIAYTPREVPAAERSKILAALREAGVEPSEEVVLDLYNQQVERSTRAE